MSRNRIGHKHVGRAKCGVCTLGHTVKVRERADAITAQEQLAEAHTHAGMVHCDKCCVHCVDDYPPEDDPLECNCFDDYVCNMCNAMWPTGPLRVPMIELL